MNDAEAPLSPNRKTLVYDVLLVVILAAGLALRLVGIDWDEGQYLHPDERFLMFVESSIQPIQSLGEYFDTAVSPLNPHNVGHPLFVYGTWPIFAVRYLLEWTGITGGQVWQLGRPLSALVNIATVLLVYLVGTRLYDRRVGLLASAFSAFSVLDIQLSHFFKEDTFMSFFTLLTLYFAVRVATRENPDRETVEVGNPDRGELAAEGGTGQKLALSNGASTVTGMMDAGPPIFRSQWATFVLFGIFLGMAMASKINAFPIALTLPVAVFIRIQRLPEREEGRAYLEGFAFLSLAAVVSFLTFRVLQPYAFSGPGFLGLQPNPRWLENLSELRRLTSPESVFGFPPSLQWSDRPLWFAWENLVRWGLGLPLGLLAWAGFLWIGWRILRGQWQRHILLWGWTALYFAWQSSVFNPTMRYQLPVYPTLTLMAAWAVFALWDLQPARWTLRGTRLNRILAPLIGGGVLIATVGYAVAFTRIYTQPVTRVAASRWIFAHIPGAITLPIQLGAEHHTQQLLPFPEGLSIRPEAPYQTTFIARNEGRLKEVLLPNVVDREATPGEEVLTLVLRDAEAPDRPLAQAAVVIDLPSAPGQRGQALTVPLDSPVFLGAEKVYQLEIEVRSANTAAIGLYGSALANESSWDDGLPLRLDGLDPYGGIYQGGLNFEMYWEDNPEKRERFIRTLDQADYVLISSSRQWGSVGRLPERFPLSTTYYRALLGCPLEMSIERCYNQAQVGDIRGQLGFELVRVFQSDPQLGPLSINDQASEEAFTVYDHPKVFIFEKQASYDPAQVRAFFEAVPLDGVDLASEGPQEEVKSLLLPPERLQDQRQGGTWTELFRTDALVNQVQAVGVAVWYLTVALLGWVVYPVLRRALPGLEDRGYPLARTAGLLTLSYIVWLAGSFQVPFERLTISLFFLALAMVAGVIAFRDREGLRQELRQRRKYFLAVEVLALIFFLGALLIRFSNPDLWHPWKGGEKPMDFSYFNAVLKSTSFPPYDPWYAGGYINYYYYGFVLVGVVVKWLGIVPAIAYNLILPTLFALMALGAFSLGWNLLQSTRSTPTAEAEEEPAEAEAGDPLPAQAPRLGIDRLLSGLAGRSLPWLAGLATTAAMVVLGNLGVLRMIVLGYQRLAASGGTPLDQVNLLTRAAWTVQGFLRALAGTSLPYGIADWYWNPSRAIPAPNDVEPITEFPFFTFLYADLHAHLIALPLTLFVLAWALSVILARGRWPGLVSGVFGFLLGGLAIGALRPTNTWDFYPYLALGALALIYAIARYGRPPQEERLPSAAWKAAARLGLGLMAAAVLAGLAHGLFQPYADWYGQGYNAVDLWQGTHTPVSAYFTHWGVFLFIIASWMAWETVQWMSETPLSALRKLEPYKGLIQLGSVLFLVWIAVLLILEVRIAWVVLPLALWAGILLLKPGLPDAQRASLFLVGTGLVLTLMVEVIVLRGDIGRMNTVFKFYLQVWTLFAVSAGGAFAWLWRVLPRWSPNWRRLWGLVVVGLVGSAALYPLLGGLAKVRDRMVEDAPRTLDGMAYMAYATYNDLNTEMDLSQDYQAIRWLQDNVNGSPVIVEGNMVEYHWGTRYSIYTGLPGVLGWNWHQRQQRALHPGELVTDRVVEIDSFYTTASSQEATNFLTKYEVKYIVLGQLERAKYAGEGLEKFERLDGVLWQEVFRTGETVIYQVLEPETTAHAP